MDTIMVRFQAGMFLRGYQLFAGIFNFSVFNPFSFHFIAFYFTLPISFKFNRTPPPKGYDCERKAN